MEKLTSFWWDMETGEDLEETPEMRKLRRAKEDEMFWLLPARIDWVRWDVVKNETPEE